MRIKVGDAVRVHYYHRAGDIMGEGEVQDVRPIFGGHACLIRGEGIPGDRRFADVFLTRIRPVGSKPG